MADLVKLKAELDSDPATYDPLSAQQVADLLNTADQSVEPDSLSTGLFLRGLVRSEWNAILLQSDRDYLALLLGQDAIDIRVGTETRAALLALFPNGTQTRANLLALATVQVSRATKLGIGFVTPGEVEYVRTN